MRLEHIRVIFNPSPKWEVWNCFRGSTNRSSANISHQNSPAPKGKGGFLKIPSHASTPRTSSHDTSQRFSGVLFSPPMNGISRWRSRSGSATASSVTWPRNCTMRRLNGVRSRPTRRSCSPLRNATPQRSTSLHPRGQRPPSRRAASLPGLRKSPVS
ncbi:hypothetical protein DSECCO2_518420 [anaerobic digester metagenome]